MYFFSYPVRTALKVTVLSAAVLLAPAAGFAEEAPINIEADRMISQEAKNTVVFIGNVDASQGEVTIRTDEMTVHYEEQDPKKDKKSKKQSSKVKKLICIGNVEVTQEDWLGTGKRMDYFADKRKVILSGDAKAWQGQNMVSGKTIIYYLDEKRSEVEGGTGASNKPGRVRAVIQQK